jgi:hypothetical protein
MSKEIRCTVTDDEYDQIKAFVARKGKFSRLAHYLRFLIFTDLARGRPGAHHPLSGRNVGRPPKESGKIPSPDSEKGLEALDRAIDLEEGQG